MGDQSNYKRFRLDLYLNEQNPVDAEICKYLLAFKAGRVRNAEVRAALEQLVNDPDYTVRTEVARQGYGLDQLVNDPEISVRVVVARQGYGLDQLINDPVATVRMEVAMQNYGLMKLIHDPSTVVRDCAEKQLRKRAAEQNLPEPKFSRPKTKGKVR